jgi:hypothetical protein
VRYTTQEAQELLARAARLQVETGGDSEGVDLQSLERIAAEAGIDPAYLQLAALQPRRVRKSFFGLVEEWAFEIPGEEHISDVQKALASLYPWASQIGMSTSSVRAQVGVGRMGLASVASSAADGRTIVRVKSLPLVPYMTTLHWIGLVAIIAGGNLISRGQPLLGWLTMMGGFAFGATLFFAFSRPAASAVEGFAQRLSEAVARRTAQSRLPSDTDLREEQLGNLKLGQG